MNNEKSFEELCKNIGHTSHQIKKKFWQKLWEIFYIIFGRTNEKLKEKFYRKITKEPRRNFGNIWILLENLFRIASKLNLALVLGRKRPKDWLILLTLMIYNPSILKVDYKSMADRRKNQTAFYFEGLSTSSWLTILGKYKVVGVQKVKLELVCVKYILIA